MHQTLNRLFDQCKKINNPISNHISPFLPFIWWIFDANEHVYQEFPGLPILNSFTTWTNDIIQNLHSHSSNEILEDALRFLLYSLSSAPCENLPSIANHLFQILQVSTSQESSLITHSIFCILGPEVVKLFLLDQNSPFTFDFKDLCEEIYRQMKQLDVDPKIVSSLSQFLNGIALSIVEIRSTMELSNHSQTTRENEENKRNQVQEKDDSISEMMVETLTSSFNFSELLFHLLSLQKNQSCSINMILECLGSLAMLNQLSFFHWSHFTVDGTLLLLEHVKTSSDIPIALLSSSLTYTSHNGSKGILVFKKVVNVINSLITMNQDDQEDNGVGSKNLDLVEYLIQLSSSIHVSCEEEENVIQQGLSTLLQLPNESESEISNPLFVQVHKIILCFIHEKMCEEGNDTANILGGDESMFNNSGFEKFVSSINWKRFFIENMIINDIESYRLCHPNSSRCEINEIENESLVNSLIVEDEKSDDESINYSENEANDIYNIISHHIISTNNQNFCQYCCCLNCLIEEIGNQEEDESCFYQRVLTFLLHKFPLTYSSSIQEDYSSINQFSIHFMISSCLKYFLKDKRKILQRFDISVENDEEEVDQKFISHLINIVPRIYNKTVNQMIFSDPMNLSLLDVVVIVWLLMGDDICDLRHHTNLWDSFYQGDQDFPLRFSLQKELCYESTTSELVLYIFCEILMKLENGGLNFKSGVEFPFFYSIVLRGFMTFLFEREENQFSLLPTSQIIISLLNMRNFILKDNYNNDENEENSQMVQEIDSWMLNHEYFDLMEISLTSIQPQILSHHSLSLSLIIKQGMEWIMMESDVKCMESLEEREKILIFQNMLVLVDKIVDVFIKNSNLEFQQSLQSILGSFHQLSIQLNQSISISSLFHKNQGLFENWIVMSISIIQSCQSKTDKQLFLFLPLIDQDHDGFIFQLLKEIDLSTINTFSQGVELEFQAYENDDYEIFFPFCDFLIQTIFQEKSHQEDIFWTIKLMNRFICYWITSKESPKQNKSRKFEEMISFSYQILRESNFIDPSQLSNQEIQLISEISLNISLLSIQDILFKTFQNIEEEKKELDDIISNNKQKDEDIEFIVQNYLVFGLVQRMKKILINGEEIIQHLISNSCCYLIVRDIKVSIDEKEKECVNDCWKHWIQHELIGQQDQNDNDIGFGMFERIFLDNNKIEHGGGKEDILQEVVLLIKNNL